MNVSCVGLLFLEEIVDPCLNVLAKGARGQPLGSVRVVFPLCSTRFMAIITYKPGQKKKNSENEILISIRHWIKRGCELTFSKYCHGGVRRLDGVSESSPGR